MRYFVLGFLFLLGCGSPPQIAPPDPPVVTVEKPVERKLDTYYEFTGYLRAAREVEVRAQVTGYLKAIKFQDGHLVRAGLACKNALLIVEFAKSSTPDA